MGQKKLLRFNEIKTFPNVLEYPQDIKGKWKDHFKNNNPVVLELACGKGEYTIGLAEMDPQKNFIGVDIKGNRLWVGAKSALEKKLTNVAFLRTQIDKIDQYFEQDEVEEIWITFPDPFLRTSRAKKRLTHPRFLRLYQRFLKKDGLIHLKTDSPDLYQFTKTVIELYGLKIRSDISDVYTHPDISPGLKIQTYYESLDISESNTVFYLSFYLPEILKSDDEKLHSMIKAETKSEVMEDDDFYFNDNGLTVFTEKYLLERGYCCGNGCKNCPYDYKMVPEPRKSLLLAARKNN